MRKIIPLAIALLSIAALAFFMLQSNARRDLSYLWPDKVDQLTSFFHIAHGWYYYLVYGALIVAIIFIIFRGLKLAYPFLKYPYFFIFLPAVIFPVLRCYFKVPYIFCRSCPRPCPWGWLRPALIPGFLILNLDNRFWCFRLCPLGTLQDYQSKVCKKRIHLPKLLTHVRYLFLIFTVVIVFMTIFNPALPTRGFFFTVIYHLAVGTAIFSLVVLVLAFLIPRFWCNHFCPIGTFSDLVLKIRKLFPRKN